MDKLSRIERHFDSDNDEEDATHQDSSEVIFELQLSDSDNDKNFATHSESLSRDKLNIQVSQNDSKDINFFFIGLRKTSIFTFIFLL